MRDVDLPSPLPPELGEPAAAGPKGKRSWSKPEVRLVAFEVTLAAPTPRGTTHASESAYHPTQGAYDPNIS